MNPRREILPTRVCSKCEVEKPIEKYSKIRKSDAWTSRSASCKDCRVEYNRQRLKANPEKKVKKAGPERHHTYALKSKYGITKAEYTALSVKQDGKCAICKVRQSGLKYRLAVDHDHVTGKVRGLLCLECNMGLGKFKDSPEIIESAANYLRLHQTIVCQRV